MLEQMLICVVIFVQLYEIETISRNQINKQISIHFASKCPLYRSDFGYLTQHIDGVCKIPAHIPKGRLLSIDGLDVGSTAKFICDDYYFTNITHGVCTSHGTWGRLENPCIHIPRPPYLLRTVGRLRSGRCVIILTTPTATPNTLVSLWFKDMKYRLLHTSFHFNTKMVVRNTIKYGRWGREETKINFWPLKYGRETNLTYCIEDTMYMCFADGKELFTFRKRFPRANVAFIRINYMIVRRIQFIDGKGI